MIPLIQSDLTFKTGDCFRTCIASILEWELDAVPNFNIPSTAQFEENLIKWCERQDFILLDVTLEDPSLLQDCWVVASGLSPRATNGQHHSVVWKSGKMIHDPHPSGAGLDGEPLTYTIFINKGIFL